MSSSLMLAHARRMLVTRVVSSSHPQSALHVLSQCRWQSTGQRKVRSSMGPTPVYAQKKKVGEEMPQHARQPPSRREEPQPAKSSSKSFRSAAHQKKATPKKEGKDPETEDTYYNRSMKVLDSWSDVPIIGFVVRHGNDICMYQLLVQGLVAVVVFYGLDGYFTVPELKLFTKRLERAARNFGYKLKFEEFDSAESSAGSDELSLMMAKVGSADEVTRLNYAWSITTTLVPMQIVFVIITLPLYKASKNGLFGGYRLIKNGVQHLKRRRVPTPNPLEQ